VWEEFEKGETDDARFARAMDRLQPVMTNVVTNGGTWDAPSLSDEQVKAVSGTAVAAGKELWSVCAKL
jgi:putative hydrolase of HD superfamily